MGMMENIEGGIKTESSNVIWADFKSANGVKGKAIELSEKRGNIHEREGRMEDV
jgi:hypothetical protein